MIRQRRKVSIRDLENLRKKRERETVCAYEIVTEGKGIHDETPGFLGTDFVA